MGRTRRGQLTVALLVSLVVGVGAGLYWFQPWKLWQDETVTESLPGAVVEASRPPGTNPGTPSSPSAPTGPVTLATGELISHEHTTSGTVTLVRLADGTHVIRLERLDTSNGPDLRVWLTDAPVKEGRAGWHVFDDGEHVSLGRLKGNRGSQNYPLPEDIDPSRYTSVTIWCDRFDVSFGAAELLVHGGQRRFRPPGR
ncbi:DM13 domain-containing protein [Streptomyces europaeiscabiei]|uniref:DM13 domain-containing protein n=1 Tax=Streptomyces europaeiscabiei TaxID=146819 RepID=UPI0029B35FCA|nr:DM13 domain-containing protein [Streptomyces europaeiscabiei]MDX3611819.1 DM13 domain-containing protein [Streptomyces europaeiscabiei]